MVPFAIALFISVAELLTSDVFTHGDGFEHRAIGVRSAAHIVDSATVDGLLVNFPKGTDQVMAVDVIANLFPLVPKDSVRLALNNTLHQVREKTVQLGA